MSNKPTDRGELYVIAAPSGAGKSSQIQRLLEQFPNLAFSVSATTRSPRKGENDGEHYHFIDRETFRERIGQGRFLEHAEVFGHYYGTDRAHVEQFCSKLTCRVRRRYVFLIPKPVRSLSCRRPCRC